MTTQPARLRLRSIEPGDAASINRWKNDREIQKLSQDHESVETLAESEARIERWMAADPDEIEHWGIELVKPRGLIGFCHLADIDRHNARCKVGIVIGDARSWGNGFGREALRLLVNRAFERGLTRVAAEVYASNARSLRLLESVGFELEGRLRRSVRRGSGWIDELIYAVVAPGR